MKILKSLWPIGLLIDIELLLFVINYHAGTYLAGWDGLYPEFNFPLNLMRNFFAVWQEYRGVGLYDGMSYASNLVHTLFLWLLSLAVPQDMLRYTFLFLMHGVGMIGMYLLLQKLFSPFSKPSRFPLIPFFGALFYGFNIGIIQLFYAPLEVFAIHFGMLPLLVYALLHYLQTPSRRHLLLFAFFSILATPQGFVPQIFISYLLMAFSILVVFGVYQKWNTVAVKQCIVILITIFSTNAFWLLPYVYGLPHNAQVIMDAKINQMASSTMYQMNQNRGSLHDMLTMKGFMLDVAEFVSNRYGYIMQEWRDYTVSVFFVIPALIFLSLLILGISQTMRYRQKSLYPFLIAFSITGFFLGNAIFGLNLLNSLLRFLFPVFNEAFRFPFTKFETLFAFSYTILLAAGLQRVSSISLQEVKRFFSLFPLSIPEKLPLKHAHTIFSLLLFLCLLIYSLPSFQGHFLFEGVRVQMEPDYADIITFLKTQPPTARIATLPQPTFYNWEYHRNNYRGSGFAWYGIPQATLERSFDPWSNYNENYYWELSQALYSDNPQALKNVFVKYQVGYILIDANRMYPFAPKSLYIPQTQDLLAKIGAQKIYQTGKSVLYKLPATPVFAADNLPTVNAYQWTDQDVFYQLHGPYISSSQSDFALPFRSLFSNHQPTNQTLITKETPTTVSFTASIPQGTSHITLPAFTSVESFIAGELVFDSTANTLSFVLTTPAVSLDKKPLPGQKLTYPLFTIPVQAFPLTVKVNNESSRLFSSGSSQTLGTYLLPVAQNTWVTIRDAAGNEAVAILPKDAIQSTFSKPLSISLSSTITDFPLTVSVSNSRYAFSPQLAKAKVVNCNNLTQGKIQFTSHSTASAASNSLSLSAQNADACLSFFDTTAPSSQGYLLSLNQTHTSGNPLTVWVEDPSQQYTFLYTRLGKNDDTAHFVLPPRELYNMGYSMHLENISLGDTITQNDIHRLSLTPIPYNFLTHILADSGKNPHFVTTKDIVFSHPNPSLYTISPDVSGMEKPTIILSQAYDPGWHAYSMGNYDAGAMSVLGEMFPFFFGEELTDHVKVNNWENGWRIAQPANFSKQSTIILVFLPQYLEYIGFGILGGYSLLFLLLRQKKY